MTEGSSRNTFEALLARAREGDEDALGVLVPLVYDELRRVAAAFVRRERPGGTLQATALVHEAYLRLLGDLAAAPRSRAHFFGIAARSMRQVLVERARARAAAKRGGAQVRVTFSPDLAVPATERPVDVDAIDAALTRLEAFDPELAQLVELRFFGGLSIEETADAMRVSPATIKRRWTLARAWLARELGAS